MFKSIYTTIFISVFFYANAQFELPSVPPSPNSSGLVRQANIQVGHYTGVPNISVPLGVLGGKGISIPVSLDYHASGIKVQDVASSAGLGFNLSVGGVITRVVRGLPDFNKRFCAFGPNDFNWQWTEDCDGERDIFYYSMPGRSGKMFFNEVGNVYAMPYQEMIIKPGIGPLSMNYWTITDENGYVYYYGESDAQKESTTYYVNDSEKYTYVSTWYLSRIVSPAGENVATFSYITDSDYEFTMFAHKGVKPTSGNLVITASNVKIKIKQAKYLNFVSTSLGSIQFNYQSRLDVPNSKAYQTIEFKDIEGSVKKRYHFAMDYFLGDWNAANRSLRLLSIKEGINNPISIYSFSYYEMHTSTDSFGNPVSHNPNRNSYYFNHFGYHGRHGDSYSCSPAYNFPIPCAELGIVSRDASNLEQVRVFTLKEMVNASGGKTTFDYESSNGRGLRIKTISVFNGGTTPVGQSTFTYAGASTFTAPVYNYEAYNGSKIWSSSSLTDLYDLDGVTIGYSSVTETFLDGSKIVREFTNFSNYADETPVVRKYLADPPAQPAVLQGNADVNGPPFASRTTRFWMRGLPRFVKVYDAQNNLLSMEEMQYEEGGVQAAVTSQALHGYQFEYGSNPKRTYISGTYHLRSVPVFLKKKIVSLFDQGDFTKAFVQTFDYQYQSKYLTLPSSMIISTGPIELINKPQQKVTFKYPKDIAGISTKPTSTDASAAGIWALIDKHIITNIEKLIYMKDFGASFYKIVGGELSTYNVGSNNEPFLKSTFSLVTKTPLVSLSNEATLTSSGSVFSYDNSRYKLISTYTYDNDIKQIVNVTDNRGITMKYNWESGNTLLSSSAILLNNTEKYKTQYSYNSIYGIEKITDANNLSTRYEYDKLGRLKLIRDNSGNIIVRYRYNYANVNEVGIDFTMSGTTGVTGRAITFSSSADSESVGVNRYIWDFGDGVISEGTSSVNHVYSTPGTYTVKLVKINPEYGDNLITSKQITIYSSLTLEVTNSVSSINLCSTPRTSEIRANASGGCPPFTYAWYTRLNSGNWVSWGSSTSKTFSTTTTGLHEFRCVITDSCGNTIEKGTAVGVFKSPSNCPVSPF